jgi:site-specific recombinase XerD
MNTPQQPESSAPTVGASAAEPATPPPRSSDIIDGVIYSTPQVDQSAGPLSLREAVARYLTLRVSEGLPEDGDTFSHLTKHLSIRLCAALGAMPLKLIRADHLRAWVTELTNDRTRKPLELLTKRHHLIAVKTFFRRCWREGWIERDPTMPIVLPTVEERDVNIVTTEQAFHFFKVNRDHRAIGRVALEAFGGLRYTSAGKLTKADIKFDRRGIEMPSNKHKSRKRKYRQRLPPCLWAWLNHVSEECWSLTFRQYREEKKEMSVMAGLRPMILKTDKDRHAARELKNVWRHSFASYLLAKEHDFGAVAYLMQHARATTTEIYEGRADELDAYRYFSITPAAVTMTWEKYCASIPTVPPAFPDPA